LRYVRPWSHLCQLFTSNFYATCARLGVDWDLANVIQKKGESLQKFIQRFCNKRIIILEVDDKSIIKFFKKGLRESSLIRKLTMKNPMTSKEMLAITNKYILAKEVTLNNKEQKELGHDKKRKADRSVNNVEQPRHK
jgi:hypothetical protein